MAAAVAGNSTNIGTSITKQKSQSVDRNSSSLASSSSSDEMDDYLDNIRDQPHPIALTTTTLLGKEARELEEAHATDVNRLSRAENMSAHMEAEAKYSINTDLKNIFRLIEEFEAEKMEIEPVLKPFVIDVSRIFRVLSFCDT
jgi:hypothetical protein